MGLPQPQTNSVTIFIQQTKHRLLLHQTTHRATHKVEPNQQQTDI